MPFAATFRRTDTGVTVLEAPTSVSVIVPVDTAGKPVVNCTLTLRMPVPVPTAGDTVNHGEFEVAIQLTDPAPFCITLNACEFVFDTKPTPLLTAATSGRSDPRTSSGPALRDRYRLPSDGQRSAPGAAERVRLHREQAVPLPLPELPAVMEFQ